jgi:hypothetical protein
VRRTTSADHASLQKYKTKIAFSISIAKGKAFGCRVSGVGNSIFGIVIYHLWGVALEIKIVKFQAQFCLAPHINLEIDVLKIGLDGSYRDAHLEGDLFVLASLTSQVRHLSLTGRKRQPAVIRM